MGEFFGFDGRINRLGYLWRSVAVMLALGLVAAGAVAAGVFVLRPRGLADLEVWGQRLAMAMALLALWSGLALASRRLRDMGLEPAHVVPLYAALWVINVVLVEPLARLYPGDFTLLHGGWIGLQLLVAVPLLFWPSRARPPPAPPQFVRAEPTAYADWRSSAG
jgi:uncharacterized membrane protein YhaH (DUF805 family)